MRNKIQIQLIDDGTPLDFEITQMSATRKESWILRALLLLSEGAGSINIDLSGEADINGLMSELGKKGLGIFSGITPEKVQPLLDDLLACCSRVMGQSRQLCTPATVDGYISDVKTLFRLRVESFKVNFPDFFTEKFSTEEGKEKPSDSGTPVTLKIPRG